MKRLIAAFLGATTLGGGALYGADAKINPYEVSTEKYELASESTIESAGENKIEAHRDRPAVTLSKWNGEAAMTVAYRAITAEGARQFLTEKVEWEGDTEEMHAYPLPAAEGMEDGGFEIEIVLDEAPDHNVFEFAIEDADDLDFFYQPALTDEEIAEGAVRPENVIGSYAVYHKTKANHRVGDTNYATGKAYHIYRPKAVDADGAETWAELDYANGVLSVTVPEEWLAKAAYPVRVDPTFGFQTIGASSQSVTFNEIYATKFALGVNANTTNVTFWASRPSPSNGQKAIIFDDDGTAGAPNTNLDSGDAVSAGPTPPYTSNNVITSLSPGDYWLSITSFVSSVNYFYDTGGASKYNSGTNWFTTPPATWPSAGETDQDRKYSIYANFTTSDAGTFTDYFFSNGYNSWTAPTGVTEVIAACWGAGGGGGVIASDGGAGGGGGAFASSTLSVTPGNTYGIRIGAGGAADSDAWALDSSFATTSCPNCVIASGGSGASPTARATNGLGGPVASSTGTTKFAGGPGGDGNTTGDAGGGGGGAGGPHGGGGTGGTAVANAGGGAGANGGGNGGDGSAGSAGPNAGAGGAGGSAGINAGTQGNSGAFGGGGGGGGTNSSGANAGAPGGGGGGGETGGGTGGNGQCTLTYTIAAAGGDPVFAAPDDVIIFE